MKHKLGIVGVGEMGFPIVCNLKNSSFDIVAYVRREEVAVELRKKDIMVVKSPKELAERSDVIIDILSDVNATRSVMEQEDGLIKGFNRRKILIDMTTSDPEESIRFGEYLKTFNVEYLDSPITGGKIGAESRNLVIMVGGEKSIYEECSYIFDLLAKKVFYLGTSGNGHYMKLIHNQLSHSTFLATCEAVLLGKALGLEPEQMVDVFNSGNAHSYATEVRFPKFILSKTFMAGASFKTVHKDIGLVLKKAHSLNYDLPITAATYQYWHDSIEKGQGNDDYSTVYKIMEEKLAGNKNK